MTLADLAVAADAPAGGGVTGSPLLDLLVDNIGPTVVVVLFLLGKITTGAERDRLADKLERTEAQRDALRDGYDERVIPLLTRTLDLLERLEVAERARPPRADDGRS